MINCKKQDYIDYLIDAVKRGQTTLPDIQSSLKFHLHSTGTLATLKTKLNDTISNPSQTFKPKSSLSPSQNIRYVYD